MIKDQFVRNGQNCMAHKVTLPSQVVGLWKVGLRMVGSPFVLAELAAVWEADRFQSGPLFAQSSPLTGTFNGSPII